MKFSIAAAASALLATAANARIIGIAVPDEIKPGTGFNAIIMTENYIQSVYDVAIVFGYKPDGAFPESLGTPLGSYYLGPEQSNTLHNITKWVEVPASAAKGAMMVDASLLSLYGAVSLPILSNYNVSVTFGDQTSTHYVSSLNF